MRNSASSAAAVWLLNNMAFQFEIIGQTARAWALYDEALVAARELGNRPVERFVSSGMPFVHYARGDWDRTLAEIDSFLSDAERTGGLFVEADLHSIRSHILVARGETEAARTEADRSIAAARRAGDPQVTIPALCNSAWLFMVEGLVAGAKPLLAELLDIPNSGISLSIEGALALAWSGLNDDLGRIAAETASGLWRDTYAAIAEGRFLDAVALQEEQGYRPQPALLRLEAARELAARGAHAEAAEALVPAIEFWQSVGATYWLAQAERLIGTPLVNRRP